MRAYVPVCVRAYVCDLAPFSLLKAAWKSPRAVGSQLCLWVTHWPLCFLPCRPTEDEQVSAL